MDQLVNFINGVMSSSFITGELIPFTKDIIIYTALSILCTSVFSALSIATNKGIIHTIVNIILSISFIFTILGILLIIFCTLLIPIMYIMIALKLTILTVSSLPEVLAGILSALILIGVSILLVYAFDDEEEIEN